MKKLKHKYQTLKFDQKMSLFISIVLGVSLIVIMCIAVISSIWSTTNQSRQLVEEKVQTMVVNTEQNFEQYQGLFWALALDSNIQKFLKDEDEYSYVYEVRETLENVTTMWENVNFVAIISKNPEKSYIKQNISSSSKIGMIELIINGLNHSMQMSKKSTSMRTMTYNNSFNRNDKYSLTLYQPIYSDTMLDEYIGLACINVRDSNLDQLLIEREENDGMNNYFLHGDGTIVVCEDESKIGEKIDVSEMNSQSGYFWKDQKLNVYMWMEGWNYLYLSDISFLELCKNNLIGIIIMICIMGIIFVGVQIMSRKIVRTAYRPWQNVAKTMDQITQGEISARLEQRDTDPDMKRITKGFNVMMEKILQLMEQVKNEQHQLDQTKFDALQSQIQPHFLYNTLDCIHWQAVIDGNQEISKLTKSLAAYYRICLSKGREIIQLNEELEHIRNYLYIQQLRYGEIITYTIDEKTWSDKIKIPKLTLQPLVENSIYHGIKVKDGVVGHLMISLEEQEDNIIIVVEDSGQGMSEKEIKEMNQSILIYDESMGYGVCNVNRRIKLLFGEQYGLHYKGNQYGGLTVEVCIPKEGNQEKGEFYV